MAKFRKKPVVIEAVQWWPPGHEQHDPSNYPTLLPRPEWAYRCADPQVREVIPGSIWWVGAGGIEWAIYTLEGNMTLSPGDWIITGVKGEHYPCKPDIFDATYEPV